MHFLLLKFTCDLFAPKVRNRFFSRVSADRPFLRSNLKHISQDYFDF